MDYMSPEKVKPKHVLTVQDMAEICDLKKSTAYAFIKDAYESDPQPFPIHKIGGRHRIPKDEFIFWLQHDRNMTFDV